MVWLVLIALILSALILAACSASGDSLDDETARAQSQLTSTPIPTAEIASRPTYVVQRGTVEDVFSFTGRWQPRDQMVLSFPINGTIRQVNVQRGDAVSAGDLLADYDISDLENQLALARQHFDACLEIMPSGRPAIAVSFFQRPKLESLAKDYAQGLEASRQ